MVPFFVKTETTNEIPTYPGWPLAPSPELDRLVDWLESCPDDERELAWRGERVAESMIEDHGLREHRGCRAAAGSWD